MATAIAMPRQGQSVETCVISDWHKKVGDTISKGEIFFSYETDKASFEFESPEAGTVLAIFAEKGVDVPVLTNIAVIGNPNEDFSALKPGASETGSQAGAPVKENAVPLVKDEPKTVLPDSSEVVSTANDSPVSPRARRRAEEKGVVAEMLTGTGPGKRVIERDVLAAVESGNAMTRTAHAMALSGNMSYAGGTGAGGRVRAEDLSVNAAVSSSVKAEVQDTFTEVKVTKIRALIANRMMQSLSQSAQLTMTSYANASGIMSLRKKLKTKQEELGIEKITINDLIAFALARTLVKFPDCNGIFANNALCQYHHVHLAVAVDTPRGLMVPVVRFADTLSLNELAKQVKNLAKQCNEGSINPDLLSGGTITISNLGIYGIDSFTPVLNAPQVALLGINAVTPRACEKENGSYAIEPHVGFSLTIDHRYVDGAPAARFLKALCNAVEDIDLTLARLK